VRRLAQQLVLTGTVLFLTFALAPAEPSALVAAGIAVLAVTAVAGARYAAVVIRALEITIGRRSREHRQLLRALPAPSDPATPGRPRSRAPSQSIAVA
jgi:hypothetical protein